MQRRRDTAGKAWLLKKVAPQGTTLYIGAHFEVFVPADAPPPDPPPTPPPGLTPRMHLPLAMGGCGYLIDGRVVPPVKYYLFNGKRIAVRQGCSGAVTWFYHDHLGSTVATSAGESTRYWPYGSTRTGAVGTPYRYTGQELDSASGLYYYVARWYDPAVGRFLQPDTIVPSAANPQDLNRFSYARNNALYYTDPSGHWVHIVIGAAVGAGIGYGVQVAGNVYNAGLTVQAFTDVDLVKIAAGGAAGAVGAATFGVGAAVLGTGWGATLATGAVSGVASGQASRLAVNVLVGQPLTEGLLDPRDIAVDAVAGAAGAGVAKALGGARAGRPSKAVDAVQQSGNVQPYEVGTVDDLLARSVVGDDLAIHHVPQLHPARQVVPGYNPRSAPGIALPTSLHESATNQRGVFLGTARELLARNIRDLRSIGVPNSALRQLIDLNKTIYPGAY
jgi:RHS repeat-associated protein